MTQPHDAPTAAADRGRASMAPRFDQATRVALAVIAVIAALFALMILAHTGPMLLGAGCRWAW